MVLCYLVFRKQCSKLEIFVQFFDNLNIIRINTFDIDHVIQKVVCTIFDITSSYSTHLFTNMIIRKEVLILVSCNT